MDREAAAVGGTAGRTDGQSTRPLHRPCTAYCTGSINNPTLTSNTAWPGRVVVRALDLRLKRSRVRISAVPLSGNNLGQVVHKHVPLSPSSIIWSKGGDAMRLGR